VLFHQTRLGDWEVLSPHIAVSLSAILVLLKPSSIRRFLAMLIIDLVVLAIDLPLVVNHWLLLALTTLGLGVGRAHAAVRRAPWLSDPGEVYRHIAPAVRIQVVLVYLFAVLAKLNTDFLDPALSCAATMSQDLLGQVPVALYAGWQDVPAVAVTLLIEALLPIGLLMRARAWPRSSGAASSTPFSPSPGTSPSAASRSPSTPCSCPTTHPAAYAHWWRARHACERPPIGREPSHALPPRSRCWAAHGS
jgi:hypothetical protein